MWCGWLPPNPRRSADHHHQIFGHLSVYWVLAAVIINVSVFFPLPSLQGINEFRERTTAVAVLVAATLVSIT